METKPKILIVDDERFYINLLVSILKDQYKLYIATSGEQALNRISNMLPDLILLDIMMPDMDGYQTCLKIKAHPQWDSIPVVFLTGNTDQASKDKALEYGAIDLICKPIVASTVTASIKTQLK